ncbi:hypothetical protein AMTR_s00093p00092080 [Amborella trichopoda]|uniref:Uncharacterized protein n=1 Tax=Amborella trichopoda TaxID=13333 RepID=W1NU67_AMBTC|nr:hypothetical protein AMTR_s00093p00092080 [Amborella trichopoda]
MPQSTSFSCRVFAIVHTWTPRLHLKAVYRLLGQVSLHELIMAPHLLRGLIAKPARCGAVVGTTREDLDALCIGVRRILSLEESVLGRNNSWFQQLIKECLEGGSMMANTIVDFTIPRY